ncbi:DUF1684 domain-containing protein [Aquimonas voraii]|uniref:DUF1684 domain-containing protein n=1 Tax=Aquimonas voraii TaxID=265719 RepID=A0A1G6SYW8_9GAMM|nr:DUF1684 domain-containing protein [Aquimonas voraii]SDD21295.1 hypothetical protein SAMN04488509_101745 [Aquimonas voraii]
MGVAALGFTRDRALSAALILAGLALAGGPGPQALEPVPTVATPAVPSHDAEVRPTAASDAQAWLESLQAFRRGREESLRSPDGWMALVGLHWLEPGEHSLGSDEANAVRLAVGPARLGRIELLPEAMSVRLVLAEGARVLRDGAEVASRELLILADKTETPTRVDFEGGSLGLIERGGRYALRVRSPEAPTLRAFKGLNWFPPAPRFVTEARFEAHPPGQTIPIVNVLGQIEPTPNPGRLVFELEGATHTLEALGDPGDSLFLIFADRSNRRESYGAGRFLYTDKVVDGRVLLDFNRAINPPCAYTEYSTCPLPPPENRLRALVSAGEARYGHSADVPAS